MVQMLKSRLFTVCLLVMSSGTGCSMASLNARVDLLEKELNDQRSSNQYLEQRLDEVQIELVLIKKKLANPGAGSMGYPGRNSSELGEVKLSSGKKGPKYHINRPKRHKWKLHQIKVKAVDPSTVTEQLTVDHDAANRPLGGEGVEVQSSALSSDQDSQPDQDTMGLKVFNDAFSLYRSNQFAKAADALEDFSRRYPDHELASSGLYYAGKSHMMVGQFKKAAAVFKKLVKMYPRDERNAKALLLAGRCEERLGRPREARGTYMELVDAFPLTKEAVTANKRLQSIR